MVLFFYREKKEKDTLIKKYHLIYQYITYGGRLLGTFDTQDSDSRLRRCCPLLQQQIPFSGSLLIAGVHRASSPGNAGDSCDEKFLSRW